MLTTPDTLPPLSARLAARPRTWPASAWLGVGKGKHAHYFAAGQRIAACGLTAPARTLRLAWLVWAVGQRPRCAGCARRVGGV